VQFCNEAKSCVHWLVNETLWYENETRPRHLIFSPRWDRDRDLSTFPWDRDIWKQRLETVLRPRRRDRDYIPDTRCKSETHKSMIQLWLPLSCNRVRSVSHELSVFNSRDHPCNCRTDYTNWSQSHWPANWCDNLECGRELEVNRNCKKTPYSLASGQQRIQKEGNAGRLTLLCIGCTSVVQCEWTVVLQSTEMQNFSAAECGKATRSNLQTFPTWFSANYPLTTFRIPHSAEYPRPHLSALFQQFCPLAHKQIHIIDVLKWRAQAKASMTVWCS